jgi:hypothetical protein
MIDNVNELECENWCLLVVIIKTSLETTGPYILSNGEGPSPYLKD